MIETVVVLGSSLFTVVLLWFVLCYRANKATAREQAALAAHVRSQQ